MLKRLLSTVVALALLFCGATIAMEALGLLFRTGTADPESRIEPFLDQIEATLDPMNVPREADAERLWPPTEPVQLVEGEKGKAAEVPQRALSLVAEDKPMAVAVESGWEPQIVAETQPEVERKSLPASAQGPSPPVAAAVRIAAPAVVAKTEDQTQGCTGGCEAEPILPRKNGRPARLGRHRAPPAVNRIDCPLLGWLDAVVPWPTAPPRRAI
jgi:hypothetical protein